MRASVHVCTNGTSEASIAYPDTRVEWMNFDGALHLDRTQSVLQLELHVEDEGWLQLELHVEGEG